MDYVVWMYALFVILNMNGGTVSLKTLFDFFNPVFDMDVRDYAQYFRAIRSRKRNERTSVLHLQIEKLIERMEKADNK